MHKLIFALHDLRSRFAPHQAARWPEAAPAKPAAIFCATSSVPIFATAPAPPPLPKRRRDVATLRADAAAIPRWS